GGDSEIDCGRASVLTGSGHVYQLATASKEGLAPVSGRDGWSCFVPGAGGIPSSPRDLLCPDKGTDTWYHAKGSRRALGPWPNADGPPDGGPSTTPTTLL